MRKLARRRRRSTISTAPRAHRSARRRFNGARSGGLALAGVGAAHFTAPSLFDPVTGIAFPESTRRWTYSNGFTELVLGLAIASRTTRTFGVIGTVGYSAFLANRFRHTQSREIEDTLSQAAGSTRAEHLVG